MIPSINYLNVEQDEKIDSLIQNKFSQLESVCKSIDDCYLTLEDAHEYQKSGTAYRVTLHLNVAPDRKFVVVRNPSYAREYESWQSLIDEVFAEAKEQIIELA